MAIFNVQVTATDLPRLSTTILNSPRSFTMELIKYLEAYLSGHAKGSTMEVFGTAVKNSGTITLAACPAGQAVEVNGTIFVAVSGTAVAANNEFKRGVSDTADAAALAAAINTALGTAVIATSALGVVTVTALQAGAGGAVSLRNLGILASGTVTCATVVNNNTVTINGATITAKSASPSTNEFLIGASDTATATALCAAINASGQAAISGFVRATSSAAVVTIYSRNPGLAGNTITLASSGATLAVSGARLAGATVASHEGAQASSTVTVTSGSGNYTVTINGVNASGTVAYNTSDDQTAADIADAINKSTDALVHGHIYATAATNVVTITAVRGGTQGNSITLACTGTGAVAGAARLAGGAAPTTVVLSGDRLSGGSNDSKVSVTFQ